MECWFDGWEISFWRYIYCAVTAIRRKKSEQEIEWEREGDRERHRKKSKLVWIETRLKSEQIRVVLKCLIENCRNNVKTASESFLLVLSWFKKWHFCDTKLCQQFSRRFLQRRRRKICAQQRVYVITFGNIASQVIQIYIRIVFIYCLLFISPMSKNSTTIAILLVSVSEMIRWWWSVWVQHGTPHSHGKELKIED